MGRIEIILQGDGALNDWRDTSEHHQKRFDSQHYTQEDSEIKAIYLTEGMASGKPSCMIAARDPGETPVLIEMSIEMFLTIAAAFKGRYEMEGFTWV